MNASQKCIDLINRYEGFRAEPYLCPSGVATIGIGSTHYADGTAVKLTDKPITEAQANELLMATLKHYEESVNKLVKVKINQNQFDALVDFAYNCGVQNLKTSTLLKDINLGQFAEAAKQFVLWVHSNGIVLAGLYKRRLSEKNLFIESMP